MAAVVKLIPGMHLFEGGTRHFIWGFRHLQRGLASKPSPLHEAAAQDNTEALAQLVKNTADINTRNRNGDTALCISAQKGNASHVELLLGNNARPNMRNYSGHNAMELSQLYRQRNCFDLLKDVTKHEAVTNFFDHSPLNRLASKRNNTTWLASALMSPDARFILFHHNKPVIKHGDGRTRVTDIFKGDIEQVHGLVENQMENVIFLGVHRDTEDTRAVWFSLDIEDWESAKAELGDKELDLLPMYPGSLQLGNVEAALCAQARSLLDWHYRFKYCATCGSTTKMEEAGYKRVCSNFDCLSHRGIYNSNYPRVDPTVITAVVSPDQEHCLLARKASFPPGMHTCVAGFVEPGESIESACRREIEEEVGVKVDRVQYHSSQPWPNPSVLMLGCIAYAEQMGEIVVDTTELETARWFPRDELVSMLCRSHPERLFVPPHQAIAHQVIKAWLIQTAF